jgi:hypothetical protein
MIQNHLPAPFTNKQKPKDPKPKLPINDYCDYLIVIAIVLGFCVTHYNLLIKKL